MSRTTADGAELRDLAYLAIRQIDRGNPAIENIGMSFHRFYDLNSTMSQKQAVLSGHFMKLTTEIRNAAWHVVSTGKFSASFDATDNGWNLSDQIGRAS